MYTINDYVEYYKDNTFKEYPFNENDALLLSILTYLPFEQNIEKITLSSLIKLFSDYDTDKKGIMVNSAVTLLRELRFSKRFKELVFYNVVNDVNDEYQFGAYVTILDNKKIVCFKGTDNSLIGWKEDFCLSFDYLTKTQKVAIDYLKKIPFSYENKVILLGHSKGGNLAIASAINYHNFYNRVVKIYNFDGPGLPSKIIHSKEWDNIKDKVINYVPEDSIVGMLLNNENYLAVKADGIGIKSHYLPNWHVFGTYLEKGELSKASIKLHKGSNNSLAAVDHNELKVVVNSFFDLLKREGLKTTSDFRKLGPSDYKRLFKEITDVSDETKKFFSEFLKTFFMG